MICYIIIILCVIFSCVHFSSQPLPLSFNNCTLSTFSDGKVLLSALNFPSSGEFSSKTTEGFECQVDEGDFEDTETSTKYKDFTSKGTCCFTYVLKLIYSGFVLELMGSW